ncbi:hypothetical protein [Aquipseudomonas alcaligenes]|jgi:hypothetical protein
MLIYLGGPYGPGWPPFKETGDSSETAAPGQFPTSLESVKKDKRKENL